MFRLWGKEFKDNHMLRDTVICDDSNDTRTHKVFHALANDGKVSNIERLEEVYWELVNSVEEEKIFDMLSNLGILEYGIEQHLISAEQVKLLRENKKATTVNMMLTVKGYQLERFYRASLHNPKPYDILGYEYVKELLSDLSAIAMYYL